MIVLVTFVGHTGMGAQRWLNLGFFQLQPSEIMKISLIVGLAKYFFRRDLSEIKQAVIIPGRSFVHQLDAERILSADGVERLVGRGPDTLSVDGELSIDMSDENVIERELEQFNDLVDAINFFGMRIIK